MPKQFPRRIVVVLFVLAAITSTLVFGQRALASTTHSKTIPSEPIPLAGHDTAQTSHRLIVELATPPLAQAWAVRGANGRLEVNTPAAQSYIAQLEQEQARFINSLPRVAPNLRAATYINEEGAAVNATYQILINAVAVDAGLSTDVDSLRTQLLSLPNVKNVYADYRYDLDTYASLPLINAPAMWNTSAAGGRSRAGAGVKFASVDAGIHHDAPMFDGTGFTYPPGFPVGGLGDRNNNNGKIIASRVYFRPWDPPLAGDANSWPGESGSSHGVHTASTAVGNVVQMQYLSSGITETLSGVAPGAWAMSYKVFYPTNSDFSGSAFSVELIAAVEDAVADGADVINNSWGGGPSSIGGDGDALDTALVNAVRSGVFVSMSAGNAGPGLGTGDHPAPDYINVAASTTSGTYASGQLNISAPTPISPSLQGMPFGTADFGDPLAIGQQVTYSYVTAAAVDPTNVDGCNPFPANAFAGKAAVISRGGCTFVTKVLNAQNAGATFAVIYNNRDGDIIISMAGDDPTITISSIFISENDGNGVVQWYDMHGAASKLTLSTLGFQAGNTPDEIANFSSRGPSAGQGLKPDIAAPGVNIMAQGYDPLATGEDRHLGYGQVSGTSMAAPHVAGAAVLVKQSYPAWSTSQIKSALMSTSKYRDIFNSDGSPAQPLDMGAGRLDLTTIAAGKVGLFLNPPSASFGYVPTATTSSMTILVTSIGNKTDTYKLSTLYTGGGFTATTTLPGFTVTPASVTLDPGETAAVTITFDPAQGVGIGDNQGYLIMDGAIYDAHAPIWVRVTPAAAADVLIIDADFSSAFGLPDYASYYMDALDELGYTYDLYETDNGIGFPATIPDAATLAGYSAVLIFSGDNFYPNGAFTVNTPFTDLDQDILTEYANSGGIVIAMGQDLSAMFASDQTGSGSFFYNGILGADWLQDSITGNRLPSLPVIPSESAPDAVQDILLDLSLGRDSVVISGTNEVPPRNSKNTGLATFGYDPTTMQLTYEVEVSAFTTTQAINVTAAHIHTGTVGNNGPVAFNLNPTTGPITDTAVIASGVITLTADEVDTLLAGGYYINVHSTAFPGGELRGQVPPVTGDGASNQAFVDELRVEPGTVLDGGSGIRPLLRYPGPGQIEKGIVAIERRDQPTLERPGVSSNARTIYTSFGLEGVNNSLVTTGRTELLGTLMNMLLDEPTATVVDLSNTLDPTAQITLMRADFSSNISGTTAVSYRWDFGDFTSVVDTGDNATVSHQYETCGYKTVRVEVTDSLGNTAIGEAAVYVKHGCTTMVYLPILATK